MANVARPEPVRQPEERRRPKIVEAFLQDFNLIGMAGLAALAALSGSPLPLIFGAAAEALYLINAPGSRWFERLLALQRARRRQQRRELWRRQLLTRLGRSDRDRFRGAQRRLWLAQSSLDQETRLVAQAELERVENLLDELLDLLAVRQTAGRYLATVDRNALQAELRHAIRRLHETQDDPVLSRIERQRAEVLQKRLAEYDSMLGALEVVTSQVSTLEHGIGYVADKLVSWSAGGPREPQGLREVMAGIESTEQAMAQVRPAVEQLQRVKTG